MKRRLHFSRLLFFAGIALLASTSSVRAQAPEVLKVEPPGWWAGHSINPVRVLIRGKNLGGAGVHAVGAGLITRPAKINPAGTYLFVDVRIAPQTRPGKSTLRITTPRGSVEAPFEILAP